MASIMAANAAAEVQALLRFLTQDAKVPLAGAIPKVNPMRKHGLTSFDAIAKADPAVLKEIFDDEKVLKQVQNAAKRIANPRKRASTASSPTSKRTKDNDPKSEVEIEAELALPTTDVPLEILHSTTIETNRAPLFLAFCVSLLKYTMPEQPLSSRLSLAQAVTSAGAQSKAKYIGLTNSTAEDEGWAAGQPKVRIMGREVAVMRRQVPVASKIEDAVDDSQATVKVEEDASMHEAFWGLDLEALKKSNGPLVAGKLTGSSGPPIHSPSAARAYLLKSIDISVGSAENHESSPKKKKISSGEIAARKQNAVAMLLTSLDLVYSSWATTLTSDELDRRASSWYSRVRPDVEPGQAGWGQRGKVILDDILKLQKLT